jgi:ABC-type transporter Mla MlaB component
MAQSKKTARRSGSASKSSVTGVAAAEIAQQSAPAPIAAPIAAPALPAVPAAAAAPSNVLHLGSSLSIREVGECATQFKTLLASGTTHADAALLESIDTAGMQLLLVSAVAAQRRGFKLRLLNAQGIKDGAARSLGLTKYLVELAEVVP